MIGICLLILLTTTLGGTSKVHIISQSGLHYIQYGKEISLNCSFLSPDEATTTWFRHAPGEKPLLIASAYHYIPAVYYNGFDKTGRFKVLKEKNSFNLRISNAEPSDSATYYCSVAYYTDIALADWTVLILKGSSSSLSAVLQPPVSDPVELGGDTTLQCSILTDASAGEHSVYWFRHGSGESHPGIIYTHGNRSDECKKSSETDSPTQSCVYKLPKRNLSLSDAGTYYCAVLMCGEIIFGDGTKLDFVENNILVPVIIGSAALVIITVAVVLFLGIKLHNRQHKVADGQSVQANQVECDEALNYAALSFTNKPSSSRGTRRQQKLKDSEVYSQIKHLQ
ncbi:uncharacterized protein LOC108411030 isoform X2 [Pygocentrus nattereri]|uniref:uncharacterized protein LOC108411030 isoform X2 n=1 Tax=Pygocentrus nattereri TaxID=42514 RepID=UPI0018913097|nr:uncharacterized protein LOC108411030 isoform X2 [Pygocentrus nattereri]